jgi:hypothetical protein
MSFFWEEGQGPEVPALPPDPPPNALRGSERQARGPRFHELIRLATTAFLDAYLKGDAAARDWLTGGGLAQALGGEASLEMKRQRQAGPDISQKQ